MITRMIAMIVGVLVLNQSFSMPENSRGAKKFPSRLACTYSRALKDLQKEGSIARVTFPNLSGYERRPLSESLSKLGDKDTQVSIAQPQGKSKKESVLVTVSCLRETNVMICKKIAKGKVIECALDDQL